MRNLVGSFTPSVLTGSTTAHQVGSGLQLLNQPDNDQHVNDQHIRAYLSYEKGGEGTPPVQRHAVTNAPDYPWPDSWRVPTRADLRFSW